MNDKCRKTGFKAVKHTFLPVLCQLYIRLMQNILQSAKKRIVNAVKLVSKPANTRFSSYHGNSSTIEAKKTKIAKKNRVNTVETVSRPANTHIHPYFDNSTSDKRKKPPKC